MSEANSMDRPVRPPEKNLPNWTDAELLAWVRHCHTGDAVPPCRVCGGPLSVASMGGGRATKWACDMWEDDPEKPGKLRRKTGRGPADDHYERSEWTQYRESDPAVLEMARRLEQRPNAEAERPAR